MQTADGQLTDTRVKVYLRGECLLRIDEGEDFAYLDVPDQGRHTEEAVTLGAIALSAGWETIEDIDGIEPHDGFTRYWMVRIME